MPEAMKVPLEQLRLPEGFMGFNSHHAFRNYERNLPHWRQPGATYFLTFRLHDSLPKSVLEHIQQQQDIWRSRIAHELNIHGGSLPPATTEDYEAFQIRTYRHIETIMDEGQGQAVLKDPGHREIITDALLHFHRERYSLHCFAVMPNHVHVVVQPLADWQPEALLHSWKSFTANQLNSRLGTTGPLWQQDTWNRIIRDQEHWFRVMRYVIHNPDKAGLWTGQSTVWVASELLDGRSCTVKEEAIRVAEPW